MSYPPHDPRPTWMDPYPMPEEEERDRRDAQEELAAALEECPACGRLYDAPPEGCPGCGDADR